MKTLPHTEWLGLILKTNYCKNRGESPNEEIMRWKETTLLYNNEKPFKHKEIVIYVALVGTLR